MTPRISHVQKAQLTTGGESLPLPESYSNLASLIVRLYLPVLIIGRMIYEGLYVSQARERPMKA
jgi:hypothetical protein